MDTRFKSLWLTGLNFDCFSCKKFPLIVDLRLDDQTFPTAFFYLIKEKNCVRIKRENHCENVPQNVRVIVNSPSSVISIDGSISRVADQGP